MEDDNTCSLCMEVFTDPVSLPCGHGFCRECLKSLVGHISRTERRTTVTASVNSVILPCPLCRAKVALVPSGVDELQPNQNLCELMRRCRPTSTASGDTASATDMCEGCTNPADGYCAICMTLYCTTCALELDPRRGHRRLTIRQYKLEKRSRKADVKGNLSGDDSKKTNCTEHGLPLNLFCSNCRRPICTKCMPRHYNHIVKNVRTAFKEKEKDLEIDLHYIRAIKPELRKLQTEVIDIQADIATKAEQQHKEIEADYERCLKCLQDWRKSERGKVDDKRDTLTSKTVSFLKTINQQIEEVDRLVTSSADLVRGNATLFLKATDELFTRLQCHNKGSKQKLEEKKTKLTELRSELSRWDFGRWVVMTPETSDRDGDDDDHILTGDQQSEGASGYSVKPGDCPQSSASLFGGAAAPPPVLVPKLKFTSSNKPDEVIIGENGAVVRGRPGGRVCGTCVRTDGLLVIGPQYWEVEVTWARSSCSDGFIWIGSLGVLQDGSDSRYIVDIFYNLYTRNIKYGFQRGNKSNPMTCEKTSVTLGFLLQAVGRTLKVVDVRRDNLLYTFEDVDLSSSLVHVVQFMFDYHVTFRLVNLSPLSKTVRELCKPWASLRLRGSIKHQVRKGLWLR